MASQGARTFDQTDWMDSDQIESLKTILKWEIHHLLQRLSNIGEDSVIVLVNAASGQTDELGCERVNNFLSSTSLHTLKQDLLHYCREKEEQVTTATRSGQKRKLVVEGDSDHSTGLHDDGGSLVYTDIDVTERTLPGVDQNYLKDRLDPMVIKMEPKDEDFPSFIAEKKSKSKKNSLNNVPQCIQIVPESKYFQNFDLKNNVKVEQTEHNELTNLKDHSDISETSKSATMFSLDDASVNQLKAKKPKLRTKNTARKSVGTCSDSFLVQSALPFQSSLVAMDTCDDSVTMEMADVSMATGPGVHTIIDQQGTMTMVQSSLATATLATQSESGVGTSKGPSVTMAAEDSEITDDVSDLDGNKKLKQKTPKPAKMEESYDVLAKKLKDTPTKRRPGKLFKAPAGDENTAETLLLDGAKLDIGRYQCPVCCLITRDRHDLKRHLRTHTQDKPYSCDICGRKFARKYDFNNHLDRHGIAERRLREVKSKSNLRMNTNYQTLVEKLLHGLQEGKTGHELLEPVSDGDYEEGEVSVKQEMLDMSNDSNADLENTSLFSVSENSDKFEVDSGLLDDGVTVNDGGTLLARVKQEPSGEVSINDTMATSLTDAT